MLMSLLFFEKIPPPFSLTVLESGRQKEVFLNDAKVIQEVTLSGNDSYFAFPDISL